MWKSSCDICVYYIITWYALNSHNVMCQFYLNKAGKIKNMFLIMKKRHWCHSWGLHTHDVITFRRLHLQMPSYWDQGFNIWGVLLFSCSISSLLSAPSFCIWVADERSLVPLWFWFLHGNLFSLGSFWSFPSLFSLDILIFL